MTFHCRRSFLLQAVLLCLAAAGGLYIVADALVLAEGALRLVLFATSSLPLLVAAVAFLRLGTALTLRISLSPDRLIHRQIFKNFEVLLRDLSRVEVGYEGAGQVMVLKLFLPKSSYYIDGAHVEGVGQLKSELEKYLPPGRVVAVDTFSHPESV